MKKLFAPVLMLIGLIACDNTENPEPTISLPEVTTEIVSSITQTGATSGGTITNADEVEVTAKGIVWSTATNPTVALPSKTDEGAGTTAFSSTLQNLTPATTYYVRAYATNAAGTAYGDEKIFTTLSPALPKVYVAVQLQNAINKALYWRDTDIVPLSDGSKHAFAKRITVNETGVYIAGDEHNTLGKYVAKYWKDGTAVELSDGSRHAFADGLFVAGANVYVAGSEETAQQRRAKYWVNGTATNLTDGAKYAIANGVFVANSKVYVSGYLNDPMETARYWVDGVEVVLPQSAGAVRSLANGIFVVGTDVYVSGYQQINFSGIGRYVATLWKNGVINLLGNAANNSYATGVTVKNNDVYVTGYENEQGINVAKYWKNGTAVNLSDGTLDEHASSIFISDQGDVYVSGYQGNINTGIQAKYWKNGTSHTNNSGTYAWSICVY
ncbi:MAG: hypothetical protein DYG99_04200 [Bacteroidetes bacterium CHB5]|nr:hypothetical protein [Bacteroidetes bacterium CHB5]